MNEAELISLSLQSTGSILDIVALYFTVVSVYIGALHYFLNRAPWLMRLVAFAFFSGALVFLAITSIAVERTASGVLAALHKLPAREASAAPTSMYMGLERFVVAGDISVGVWAGWAMAAGIYFALLYLTFSYKMPEKEGRS